MKCKVDLKSMHTISLRETQLVLLEVIKYIDHVCRSEGITYFAAYGTLLGAVREHGFIEWDEDADLWMKRDDYERFCEAVKKYPDSRFFLQTVDTDDGYWLPSIARVCVNGTFWYSEHFVYADFHTGFRVDIFPLDYGFGSSKKNARKLKLIYLMRRYILPKRIKRLKYVRNFKNFAGWLVYLPLKILSLKTWIKLYRRILRNDTPDKSIFLSLSGVIYPAELFSDTTELKFEDMMIPCPSGYDKILTITYGDYMTPVKQTYNKTFYVSSSR